MSALLNKEKYAFLYNPNDTKGMLLDPGLSKKFIQEIDKMFLLVISEKFDKTEKFLDFFRRKDIEFVADHISQPTVLVMKNVNLIINYFIFRYLNNITITSSAKKDTTGNATPGIWLENKNPELFKQALIEGVNSGMIKVAARYTYFNPEVVSFESAFILDQYKEDKMVGQLRYMDKDQVDKIGIMMANMKFGHIDIQCKGKNRGERFNILQSNIQSFVARYHKSKSHWVFLPTAISFRHRSDFPDDSLDLAIPHYMWSLDRSLDSLGIIKLPKHFDPAHSPKQHRRSYHPSNYDLGETK